MRTSAVFFASVLVLGALAPVACTQNFGIFEPHTTGSGGAGGTGGSLVTTTTNTGGTGGMPPGCVAGDPCTDANPCTTDSCDTDTGKCAHEPVVDGPTTEGMDTPKDCLAPVCMGGVLMQAPSNNDVPEDGNPCTKDFCDNGATKHENKNEGADCGVDLYCNNSGVCVGCTNSKPCPDPGSCLTATCEPTGECKTTNDPVGALCHSGSDVCDGNGKCFDCLDDSHCGGGSNICVNNGCLSSCGTNAKDGKETDVDCGGPCPKCGTNKKCKINSDCASNMCSNMVCVAGPSCTDNTKNGTETDVDCGGTCPNKCATTKMCGVDSDCVGDSCMNNVCVPTCTDTVMNGAETDVDCGGAACVACGNTKKCSANTDCVSLLCTGNLCAPTMCSDGTKNGTETAIDCGGSCTKCTTGKACMTSTDCLSGTCAAMVCL